MTGEDLNLTEKGGRFGVTGHFVLWGFHKGLIYGYINYQFGNCLLLDRWFAQGDVERTGYMLEFSLMKSGDIMLRRRGITGLSLTTGV